ncbi:hypothetical protein SO802_029867 [Lithocarpus litseifolius]|uniref:Uncharacterized protein n=1 Tax=Lithocarpus litseifolius TaxID=425828 RepID=A0AAW2BWJ2_9ROSI
MIRGMFLHKQIGKNILDVVSGYTKKNILSPSLLINYEDGPDEENEMGPYWLSRMFEYGFVKEIKLTSHNQVSQFPQVIKKTVEQTGYYSPALPVTVDEKYPHSADRSRQKTRHYS